MESNSRSTWYWNSYSSALLLAGFILSLQSCLESRQARFKKIIWHSPHRSYGYYQYYRTTRMLFKYLGYSHLSSSTSELHCWFKNNIVTNLSQLIQPTTESSFSESSCSTRQHSDPKEDNSDRSRETPGNSFNFYFHESVRYEQIKSFRIYIFHSDCILHHGYDFRLFIIRRRHKF